MENLSKREMDILSIILGDKPNLRSEIFAILAKQSLTKEVDLTENVELLQNAFECNKCGVIMVSKYRHDFAQCVCGNAVDGGLSYVRRIGNPEDIIDLSITELDSMETVVKRLVWGTYGINHDQVLVYKRLIKLETSHLEAILKTQIHANSMIRIAIPMILTNRSYES